MLRVYCASTRSLMGRRGGEELSDYRRKKLERISESGAYAQSLGAELLLQAALKDMELATGEKLIITCGEHGKPVLTGGPAFSLSHSGERVLCALSDRTVGADIQQIRAGNQAVIRRFLSGEEKDWLIKQETQEQAFSLVWSLKESYVKFLGTGIAETRMDSFTVRVLPNGLAQIPGSNVKLWYTVQNGYVMSTCSAGEPTPETVKELVL